MNSCSLDANITLNDSCVLKISYGATIQFILGFAIMVTNIILVLGFTKKKQLTKTTFIFLSHLGTSDVLFGFLMAFRTFVVVMSPNYMQIIYVKGS